MLLALFAGACRAAEPAEERTASSPRSQPTPIPAGEPRPLVRIALTGDVMLGRGVGKVARDDPESVFADVRQQISSADLAMGNLESPLTVRPHVSLSPNALEADPATAELLAGAGFDLMGVANNHAADAGPAGVRDTLRALRNAGLRSVGAGTDAEAFRPAILEANGFRVAVLAFDATGAGVPATLSTPGVAEWNAPRARRAVRLAARNADLVIVGIHGGAEYRPRRDPYVAGLGRRLARWGADVVWGTHTHVVQPIRSIDPDGDGRRTVVATSLGNFLFDQFIPGTRRGAVLEVLADRRGVLGFRVGLVTLDDLRTHFADWRPPKGDAVALAGEWWALARTLAPAPALPTGTLPEVGGPVLASSLGDVTGDGVSELAVAFRRPFRTTPENSSAPPETWMDAGGRSAHVGLYDPATLEPMWVAGTLVRPVGALATCDGSLAVAYTTLDDPAVVGTGAWAWHGFGWVPAPDLPGPGTPVCADADGDGRTEPMIRRVERSSP